MASELMREQQQRVAPGRAVRLAAARHARRLSVHEGRLWLTGDGVEGDVWLRTGEVFEVKPGVELVAEGWPWAVFELAPCAAPQPRVSGGWTWRFWRAQPACA